MGVLPPRYGWLVRTSLTPAVRIGASISLATGLYGISFGALAVAAGLDFWQATALSALLFSGGSQFAFVGVVAGGGTGAAAVGASALLGVRNAVYGMQLNALLRPRGGPRRLLAAHVTIDESTATATAQEDPDEQRRGFWVSGLGIFLCWNAFTAAGALAGEAMGDPRAWGLDGAAVAAFLALLWPRLKSGDAVAIAVLAAAATILAVPLIPPGLPLLLAAAVAVAAALLLERKPAGDRPGTGEDAAGSAETPDPRSDGGEAK